MGAETVNDPYQWLEDIHGDKAHGLESRSRTSKRSSVLKADPDYQKDYDSVLKVMDATDRIPYGSLNHEFVFNFWQDAAHPKGVWRRTTIADYANPNPTWETLLDVDKLATDEHENWIWKGADCASRLSKHCSPESFPRRR